jgi:hypothetical protein
MDRNKAHDVLHVWHGNKAENCPVCNGTVTSDEEIIAAAKDVAAENYYPRVKPGLCDAIYCDENGKPIEKTAIAKKTEEKPKETTPTITAGENDGKGEDAKPVPPKDNRHLVSVMTEVMSFSDNKKNVPTKIKIIPTGKFNTAKYGELEITKEQLLEMKQNFEDGVRAGGALTGLPIDIEHGETQYRDAAAGWMKRLDIQDDGAYAEVEWTPLGQDLLEKGLYKFYSPEFTFDYVNNEQSIEFANVMIGGGLVNKPLFDSSLPPLMMGEESKDKNLTNQNPGLMLFISNTKDTQNNAGTTAHEQSGSLLEDNKKEDKPMDLQTILAKEKSTRTSEEQSFVAQNLEKLTDEQKVAEGFVVTASEDKKKDAVPNGAPEGDKIIEAKEKTDNVTISASELQTLKAAADQGALAFKELQKKEITDKVRALQFNEKGGKIAPAQVEPLVNLMVSMSEKQREDLTKILEGLPDRKIFGEVGSDEDLDKSKVADLLMVKAKEIAKERGLQFSEAVKVAREENPDLKDYQLQPVTGATA